MTPTIQPHPARFTAAILDTIAPFIPAGALVLDPFAGVGGIHQLAERQSCITSGSRARTGMGRRPPQDPRRRRPTPPFPDQTFDVIATSPCYGNRLAPTTTTPAATADASPTRAANPPAGGSQGSPT
jgi:tRNA G10  N-methylase Trm11